MDRADTGDVMNEPRIKIFCRSFDLRLYRLSKGLYESWGYPCIRLTDQTADGYFDYDALIQRNAESQELIRSSMCLT